MLTREEILACSDTKFETVQVPQWGGDIKVRSLTLFEQARMADLNAQNEIKPMVDRVRKAQLYLIMTCCVDDEGRPLFQKDDTEMLMTKSPNAIQALQDAIFRVSGLEPTAVEDAEKNLPTPSGASDSN